jgi:hypothetical protein
VGDRSSLRQGEREGVSGILTVGFNGWLDGGARPMAVSSGGGEFRSVCGDLEHGGAELRVARVVEVDA